MTALSFLPLPFPLPGSSRPGRRRRGGPRTGPRAFPGFRRGAEDRPATLHEFAARAAHEARSRGAAVLEVGHPDGANHGDLFDDEGYDAVCLTLPAPTPRFVPAAELPLPSERYGVVLCTDVVHRAVEPRGVLAELNRVLEPRGKVFLSTPLVVPEPTVTAVPRPPRYGLNYVMEASGFRIEAVTALGDSHCYGIVAGKKACE